MAEPGKAGSTGTASDPTSSPLKKSDQPLPLNIGDKPKTKRPAPIWKAFEGEPPPTPRPGTTAAGDADNAGAKKKA